MAETATSQNRVSLSGNWSISNKLSNAKDEASESGASYQLGGTQEARKYYKGTAKTDVEGLNAETDEAIQENLKVLDELPEDQYHIEKPDEDDLISLIKSEKVVFSDEARKSWLSTIRELERNFNLSADKRQSYLFKDPNQLGLMKEVFNIASLRPAEHDMYFEDVRRAASSLVQSVMEYKGAKKFSSKVTFPIKQSVQDLLGAQDDKTALRQTMNLVRMVKVAGRSGIEQFGDTKKAFLKDLSNFYGGEIGESVAQAVYTKVNNLMSAPLSQDTLDYLDEMNLREDFKRLKTEFFSQIEGQIQDELDKKASQLDLTQVVHSSMGSSGTVKDETLEDVIKERIDILKNIYLADDEYAAKTAYQDYLQNFAKYEGKLVALQRKAQNATRVAEALRGAKGSPSPQDITISKELLEREYIDSDGKKVSESNYDAKKMWVSQLKKDAETAVAGKSPDPSAITNEVIKKRLEEIRDDANDKSKITVNYKDGSGKSTTTNLSEEQLNEIIENLGSSGKTIDHKVKAQTSPKGKSSANQKLKIDWVKGALADKISKEATDSAKQRVKDGQKLLKDISSEFGTSNIDNLDTSKADVQSKLDAILADQDNWTFRYSGTQESRQDAGKLLGIISANKGKFQADVRKARKNINKTQTVLSKSTAMAKSINFRLAQVHTEAHITEDGSINDDMTKETLAKIFESDLEDVKAELNAVAGGEAEVRASENLQASLKKLDSESTVAAKGKKDIIEVMNSAFGKSDIQESMRLFKDSLTELSRLHPKKARDLSLNDDEKDILRTDYDFSDPAKFALRKMEQKAVVFRKLAMISADPKLNDDSKVKKLLNSFGNNIPSKYEIDQFSGKIQSIKTAHENEVKSLEDLQSLQRVAQNSDNVFDFLDGADKSHSMVKDLMDRVKGYMENVFGYVMRSFMYNDQYTKHTDSKLAEGDIDPDSTYENVVANIMRGNFQDASLQPAVLKTSNSSSSSYSNSSSNEEVEEEKTATANV